MNDQKRAETKVSKAIISNTPHCQGPKPAASDGSCVYDGTCPGLSEAFLRDTGRIPDENKIELFSKNSTCVWRIKNAVPTVKRGHIMYWATFYKGTRTIDPYKGENDWGHTS